MNERLSKVLAAAGQTADVSASLIEAYREGDLNPSNEVWSGDATSVLADGLRLLIEAVHAYEVPSHSAHQLHCALVRYLGDRS